MLTHRSFTTRLTLVVAVLLFAYGALVAVLGRHVAAEHELESLQRLSHGLARHIVGHWPQITLPDRDEADRAAREELLSKLMVVNPGIQVYVLDADGRVRDYLGEPGMVRQPQVDLQAVRDFLGGAPLPLRGTDPMGGETRRIFSAAMFAPREGDTRPPGYLYIVLDGQARELVAGQLSLRRVWQGAGMLALAGLIVIVILEVFALRRLTRPLHELAARMRDYRAREGLDASGLDAAGRDASASGAGGVSRRQDAAASGDEVQALSGAFDAMTQRIEAQAARELEQANAHREMMASVAHDLRTPLTALHGHLEALAGNRFEAEQSRDRVLSTALAQSDKVRRLSQQLFELAALQSVNQVLHRERFLLDELVADAVQKFELIDRTAAVTLEGASPGRLELDGDLHLIERALTNLIDNAIQHAPGTVPVRVSVRQDGEQAQIMIEDSGPGLPAELIRRLDHGQSLRDPPLKRLSGGIGGLGLAIAQRVAMLHGGSLKSLPAPQGGTRLCLALPLAR